MVKSYVSFLDYETRSLLDILGDQDERRRRETLARAAEVARTALMFGPLAPKPAAPSALVPRPGPQPLPPWMQARPAPTPMAAAPPPPIPYGQPFGVSPGLAAVTSRITGAPPTDFPLPISAPPPPGMRQQISIGTRPPEGITLRSLIEPHPVRGIGQIPVVGPELERIVPSLFSPLGMSAAAAFPAATAYSVAGAVGGGLLGKGLEELGAPIVETPIGRIGPRSVLEAVGSLAGPGRKLPVRPKEVPGLPPRDVVGLSDIHVAQSAAASMPPGKLGVSAWAEYEGKVRLGLDDLNVWGRDQHKLAAQQGVRLNRVRTPEGESLAESLWSRKPVESFPSERQPLVRSLYEALDAEEAAMVAADPKFSNALLADYFPHLFKPRPKGVTPRRLPSGKPFFTKERRLEGPLGEILEARPDLDLYTWDPVEMVQRRILAGVQYRASLETVERLKSAGAALPRGTAPAGWIVPRNAPPGLSQYAVPKELASVLNDWYAVSAFDTSKALNVMKRGVILAKFTKTFGGLFQNFDLSSRLVWSAGTYQQLDAIPGMARGWLRAFWPGADARMTRLELQDPVVRGLIGKGLNVSGPPDVVTSAFQEGFRGLLPVPLVRNAIDFLGSASYQRFFRQANITMGKVMHKAALKRGLVGDEALEWGARMANERMSALPQWQSALRDPSLRDFARTFGLFSIGETEGWFRQSFRVLQPKMAADAVRWWAGLMLSTAAVANVINLASTGKPLSPDQWKPFRSDGGILPLNYNTTFLRPELPWKGPLGTKQYLDLLGQADTPFRWLLAPDFALKTRLGQIPAALGNLVALSQGGKPLFGAPPRTTREKIEFGVGQLAPIPAVGFLEERSRIGETSAGLQATGWNVSSESLRKLLARRYKDVTGKDFNPETDFPIAERQPELVPILEEMRRRALKYGSESVAQREERGAFLADQEKQLHLPDLAADFVAGKEGAGEAFVKSYSDFQQAAAIATERDYFGQDARTYETPAGQLYQAYVAIEPDAYYDATTYRTDWAAYFKDKDAAFTKLPPDLQEALKARSQLSDPSAQAVEQQLRTAKDLRNQIPQKYIGLDEGSEKKVDAFVDEVETFVRDQLDVGKIVKAANVAKVLADSRNTPGLLAWYTEVQAPSSRYIDPAYDRFLLSNRAILEPFFPTLYGRVLRAQAEEVGARPTRPARPERPERPSREDLMQQDYIRRVLGLAR